MNFLSHFYFERENTNDYMVIGVVLPDLIKNADKNWNLNPQKDEYLFRDVPEYNALLTGWKRHLEVDRVFHSSEYFKEQTAILKQMILPAVETGPVKAFFLAHIGLELILDHLLLTQQIVNADDFYVQLQASRTDELTGFLRLAGLPGQQKFSSFLDDFIESRYLFSYADMENITYSLNRICMRLWPNPFQKEQLDMLTIQLEKFKLQLQNNFLTIFHEVGTELDKIK
ncbi:ACP phosphodiesterase [Pedobacter sp. MC2016-15]|uniref:ACP phosphodiesterase n=1 Tax=Pedobacter sp. MC2016-15 TaxID=2994473 RepID=UPI002246FD09|nr:ACP phosphodiesterase [Pedobacter sp. MC2016-15]MCX2479233.1 ACP phosphodiesterase [Pedobacter sp. MC2016-15]